MVYLGIIIGVGRLFKFEMCEILLVLNVNVGGFIIVGGMVIVKGWRILLVFFILVGIFGIVIVIFLGIVIGFIVLSKM